MLALKLVELADRTYIYSPFPSALSADNAQLTGRVLRAVEAGLTDGECGTPTDLSGIVTSTLERTDNSYRKHRRCIVRLKS